MTQEKHWEWVGALQDGDLHRLGLQQMAWELEDRPLPSEVTALVLYPRLGGEDGVNWAAWKQLRSRQERDWS